jgi:hypothetical protein
MGSASTEGPTVLVHFGQFVANPRHRPFRPTINLQIGADRGCPDPVQAIHQPDRGRPVVVLPQHVGLAVAVEVVVAVKVVGRSGKRRCRLGCIVVAQTLLNAGVVVFPA